MAEGRKEWKHETTPSMRHELIFTFGVGVGKATLANGATRSAAFIYYPLKVFNIAALPKLSLLQKVF